jgi:cell wall-associated NlpC family hydrolase
MEDFQISEEVLTYIDSLVGKPYKRLCYDETAYDCWTLVYHIYKKCGIILPKPTIKNYGQFGVNNVLKKQEVDWRKIPYKERQFLDVILFNTSYRTAMHIGLVLNKTQYIQADEGLGVVISRFSNFNTARIKWLYRWKNL